MHTHAPKCCHMLEGNIMQFTMKMSQSQEQAVYLALRKVWIGVQCDYRNWSILPYLFPFPPPRLYALLLNLSAALCRRTVQDQNWLLGEPSFCQHGTTHGWKVQVSHWPLVMTTLALESPKCPCNSDHWNLAIPVFWPLENTPDSHPWNMATPSNQDTLQTYQKPNSYLETHGSELSAQFLICTSL